MTNTTTQARIDAAATTNGWTATERVQRAGSYVTSYVEYRKGRRYLDVQFSVTGAVTHASHANGRIEGRGKADRIISLLTDRTN